MTSSSGPAVSVVVPCYNAASTIAETLDSAFAAGSDIEVIAVDDGSTDDTAAVLATYASRIQILSGPNRGVSAARNSGVGLARGRWIQFLDSDDLLAPGTLAERLHAAGDSHDMVICNWREFSVEGGAVVEGRMRSIDVAAVAREPQLAFATDVWAPPAAVLYRRDLVDRIGGFRASLPVIQDARYLFDAAYHGASIVHSEHVGARYRVVEGSLSRRDPGRFWADVLTNAREIEALWRDGDCIDKPRQKALRDMYNQAARGLFAARDERFFDAEAQLLRLGERPLHLTIAGPLARSLGLKTAGKLMSLVGKG